MLLVIIQLLSMNDFMCVLHVVHLELRKEISENLREWLEIKERTYETESVVLDKGNYELTKAYVMVLTFKEVLMYCWKVLEKLVLQSQQLRNCFIGVGGVFSLSGVPRKPNLIGDDPFNFNVREVSNLVSQNSCPANFNCIISNQVHSIVLITARMLKPQGVYHTQKSIDITIFNVVRENNT